MDNLHSPENWAYKDEEVLLEETWEHVDEEKIRASFPGKAFEGRRSQYTWCSGRFPNGEECLYGSRQANLREHFKTFHPQMFEILGEQHAVKGIVVEVNEEYAEERKALAQEQMKKFTERKLTKKEIFTDEEGELYTLETTYQLNTNTFEYEEQESKVIDVA